MNYVELGSLDHRYHFRFAGAFESVNPFRKGVYAFAMISRRLGRIAIYRVDSDSHDIFFVDPEILVYPVEGV